MPALLTSETSIAAEQLRKKRRESQAQIKMQNNNFLGKNVEEQTKTMQYFQKSSLYAWKKTVIRIHTLLPLGAAYLAPNNVLAPQISQQRHYI